MKNVFNWMLMATVMLGLSLSFTACSDDDDDNNGSEQKKDDVSPLDTDEARVAWRWLCALTNAEGFDTNWKSKTWEPTVGQASENSQYTRIVVVDDLDGAKVQFAKLADMEVSQLSTTQTINGGAAGTMTWTPSAAGAQNLAVVTVSSRIIPHLQKLVYCTADQVGSNGLIFDSMKGVAYYRLGDVVRDADGYYWICVRPSFAPDKGDSHWINIFNASASGKVNNQKKPIPDGNIESKYNNLDKYKNVTIKLQTKLTYDREHIYNLNNLIWALLKPQAYKDACLQAGNKGIGLGGFEYAYHGETFLGLVANFWESTAVGTNVSIWEALFGLTHSQMRSMEELNFIYQGYKWWWGTTADMWIYQSKKYETKYSGSESGDKMDIEVVKDGFDINKYAGDPAADQKAGFSQFEKTENGDITEGNWVVRYKRGDKLSNTGKYDPYNKIPGCDDIYVFNKEVASAKVGAKETQQTEDMLKGDTGAQPYARVGYVVGNDGKFYINAAAAVKSGTSAVAMVVYANANKIVEDDSDYNGLAMAIHDCEGVYNWAEGGSRVSGCTTKPVKQAESIGLLPSILNGLSTTQRLGRHLCNNAHKHPAFEAVVNMDSPIRPNSANFSDFSGWFIPSAGQVILATQAMGYTWTGLSQRTFSGNGEWLWEKAGAQEGNFSLSKTYFTSTENDNQSAYVFTEANISLLPFIMTSTVRPMLAFKMRR